ncbi:MULTISPECIES: DegT/DnrJ/EryC1/StrS family aminotransferase [unclassified Endozoicomonas]|uniref:DegT/DnrJ/EryC1/StrS family aminotransferase n=1 Tax=unclassified Endozoicomonas TaxID=2644528 RepID=UPI003BB55C37
MIKLSQPTISEEAISRVNEILRSGQLVHGEECELFEQELAEFIGVKHAIVVANGTAALHLSLLALGIGPGDAVLIPDFTFVATANVVEMVGAKAIIVDVDLSSYNMDIELLENRIKLWTGPEKLKAIMPVLEFGNPANLKQYRKIADRYGLHLIEDAACAIGSFDEDSNAGTVGDLGCFSFHPRKTLTTGEGGLVTTNDNQLAEKVKLLRNHGMVRTSKGLEFKAVGLNYRLTNFQAAIGRVILESLPVSLKKRKRLAKKYHSDLLELENKNLLSRPVGDKGHSWQTYMIVLNKHINRDEIIHKMKRQGAEVGIGAQSIISLNLIGIEDVYRKEVNNGVELYRNGLALPFHESLSESDVENVVIALDSVLTI